MSKDDVDDLKMYPVLDDEDVIKLKRKFIPPVQRPPFVKVLLGTRGSGKTATLVNEVMRSKNFYGNKKGEEPIFNDIIVFSSTLGCDSTSRHLVKQATATHSSYDDHLVNQILEYQKETPKAERKHILIIADDIAPMLKPNDAIFKLCSVHRHYLVSIYFLIQSPRLIPPIVRNCYTAMYVYRLPNAEQQDKIFSDLSFLGDKKDVKAMYNYATNKPYQFLMVDAIKNEVYKWGNLQPEFMWSKYDDNGNYNPPYLSGGKKTIVDTTSDIESDSEDDFSK